MKNKTLEDVKDYCVVISIILSIAVCTLFSLLIKCNSVHLPEDYNLTCKEYEIKGQIDVIQYTCTNYKDVTYLRPGMPNLIVINTTDYNDCCIEGNNYCSDVYEITIIKENIYGKCMEYKIVPR